MHGVFRNSFSKRAFQASKMTRTSRLFTNQASVRPAAKVSKLIFGAVVGLVAFGAINQTKTKSLPQMHLQTLLYSLPLSHLIKIFLKSAMFIPLRILNNWKTGHGGPGGGTTPMMARFFDPKIYRVILVDQRGCGESTPFANLQDNTTYDSIRDFEKLREKLKISKWQLFGGSWGSTLGLAYAVREFLETVCVSQSN
jgi:hypothetical protein